MTDEFIVFLAVVLTAFSLCAVALKYVIARTGTQQVWTIYNFPMRLFVTARTYTAMPCLYHISLRTPGPLAIPVKLLTNLT